MEIIKLITDTNFDELLRRTKAADYKNIQVNFNHIIDSPIGHVVEIYNQKERPELVYAKIEINDSVWEKAKDFLDGCSVEVVYNESGTLAVPTAVALLTTDVQPAVDKTLGFTLERVYSITKEIREEREKQKLSKKEKSENTVLEVLKDIRSKLTNKGEPMAEQKFEYSAEVESKVKETVEGVFVEKYSKDLDKKIDDAQKVFSDETEKLKVSKEAYDKGAKEFAESKEKFDVATKEAITAKETYDAKVKEMTEFIEKFGEFQGTFEEVCKKYNFRKDDDGTGGTKDYSKGVECDLTSLGEVTQK